MTRKNKLSVAEQKLSHFIVKYSCNVSYQGEVPIRALDSAHARVSAEEYLKKVIPKLGDGQVLYVSVDRV